MLSFNSIPIGIRTPGEYVEFSNVRAQKSLAPWSLRIMILGQKLAAGSQATAVPVRIFNPTDGVALFGRGSMLDRQIRAALACNPTTETWAMAAAENGAGTAATYTHTVTAAPTAAGTLAFYVAGTQVQVAIAGGMTTAQVATALGAAINANADLPVTAGVAGSVVTSTVRWKGLTGNDVDFRLNYASSDVMPAGLAITLAAGVAGAGNPDATAAIAALGDKQWHVIMFPWTDGTNLGLITTELANRRGPLEQIEGVAYASAKGSQGALATLGQGQNSPDLSISEAVGPATSWERAARDAATIAYYGGIDPARPFQTLALAGDARANSTERFTRAQRDALLNDGISTHTVDSGGNVLLERPITTYQLNAQGFPDTSYLDVNTMMTLGYLRFTLRARFAQKFPRHKLADDGIAIAPGQAIVTPSTLTAELVSLARGWEAAGLVENIDEFKQLLIVERDQTDPSRVNALIPPDIVSGFRIFAGQIQFGF